MNYSNVFGSRFPSELIPVGTKKDVDDNVNSLVQQYYQLMQAGNLNEAYRLYEQNRQLLEPYSINMKFINRLEEEIYNIGLSVLNKLINIFSPNEPATQSENSFWYREV